MKKDFGSKPVRKLAKPRRISTSAGMLSVQGTIDVAQFWPAGSSDADTVKVAVDVNAGAFRFRPAGSSTSKPTLAFKEARVLGNGKKAVISPKGLLTIRLQGIDAPELHYRPAPLSRGEGEGGKREEYNRLAKEFRQHFGEAASCALREKLSSLTNVSGKLRCEVRTAIDEPNDVFDVYGRFVGDIFVKDGRNELNVNRWLLEEGWAFPTFYSSMSREEIEDFIAAGRKGRGKKDRIWPFLRKTLGDLDEGLIYRPKGSEVPLKEDSGPVLMPKIFRRFSTWTIRRNAGLESGTFLNYLNDRPTDQRDSYFKPEEYADQGANASPLYFLGDYIRKNGEIRVSPDGMLFREKPSTLVGADGKKITSW